MKTVTAHWLKGRLTKRIVTRVKKIIALDPDITVCSNNAAFVITLATVSYLNGYVERARADQYIGAVHPASHYRVSEHG